MNQIRKCLPVSHGRPGHARVWRICFDFELESESVGHVREFPWRGISLAGRQVALKITAEKSVESRALAQMQHTHTAGLFRAQERAVSRGSHAISFGNAGRSLGDAKCGTRPQSGTALVSTLNVKQPRR